MTNTAGFAVLAWQEALDSCSSEWAEIVDGRRLNPTLGPDWLQMVVSTVAPGRDIRVLVSHSDGILNGVLPYFFRDRRMLGVPVRMLEPASNLISYHAEVVCRSDTLPMFEHLISDTGGWHVFRAGSLTAGGPTARAIEDVVERSGYRAIKYPAAASPYLPISGSWDEFLSTRNKKFRYQLRKRKESLVDNPSLEMCWFETPDSVGRLLEDILAVEERSWKAEAGIAISDRSAEQRYHELLLPFLAGRDALMANVLYHRNEPIAYNLCCVWGGWAGQLKTSFVKEFSELSPGSIVIDAAVEEAFRRNAIEFDFLGDADQHKLKWTTNIRQHVDYYLYKPGTRGQVLGLIQDWRRRFADERSQRTGNQR